MLRLEIWDLVDEDGKRTGKTVEKTATLPTGCYHLGVDVWIRNTEGKYLLQKRAGTKRRAPNMWMVTGGAVLSGESGFEAARRETLEELSVVLRADKARMLFKIRFADCINEVWLIHENIPLASIALKLDEVSEVRWLTKEEVLEMANGQLNPYDTTYLNAVFQGESPNAIISY